MDWVNKTNKAIDYVEEHLTDKIEDNKICKIMACSFTAFQNSFTQITGISLSEYIRRRKLTCAAYELQNTDEKVIDIALKYGYQSPDAFSELSRDCIRFMGNAKLQNARNQKEKDFAANAKTYLVKSFRGIVRQRKRR